jgi:hypothetical protein
MSTWTIISDLGKFIAVLAAVAAWVLSRKAALYASFDALYQGVLDKGIEKPFLRDPAVTGAFANLPPEQRTAYETYAYMVFNVCETVADGLSFYEGRRGSILDLVESASCCCLPTVADRKWLRKTWHPILVAEKQLHGAWLQNQKGGTRFKQEFLDLMGDIEKVSP